MADTDTDTDTDTPQHNGTFYPLLLISAIKGQSVWQAIKLGIELDRQPGSLLATIAYL